MGSEFSARGFEGPELVELFLEALGVAFGEAFSAGGLDCCFA
jgi:hypothetical protein